MFSSGSFSHRRYGVPGLSKIKTISDRANLQRLELFGAQQALVHSSLEKGFNVTPLALQAMRQIEMGHLAAVDRAAIQSDFSLLGRFLTDTQFVPL